MKSGVLLISLLSVAVGAAEAPSAKGAVPTFSSAVALRLGTPLVSNGRAPVILAPTHAAGQAAAVALQTGLTSRLGVAPVVVMRLAEANPGQQTCIALGNMLDNELLTRLYFSRYTFEDARFPGPAGFTVHTVYDPQHWGGGQNVIVLGASRPEALALAVERFLGLLQGTGASAEVPYAQVVEPVQKLTPAARAALAAKAPEPSFTAFRSNAELYLKSGEEAYAQMALAALDIMVGIYGKDAARKSPWPEETTAGDIFAAWDAFEECPLITPEKRAAYLGAFFLWSRDLTKRSYEYSRIDENFTVTWNHTTFALLGLYHAGRYFDRHFGVPEAAEWARRARLGFSAQARSWKPQEDADSYLVLTLRHVLDYALAEWDLRFFESGLIRQYADYVVACGDNRQWPAGFGDSGYSSAPTMALAALPVAFWWTRDGAYLWILNAVSPKGVWQNPYWQDVQPHPPTRFTGLNVLPLDRQIYEDTQKRPSYNEEFAKAEVAFEEAWDKISFRENWTPEGQYLLLDGFGRGKHLHFDTNGITTFVQDGERWLLDHDYLVRNTTEHSLLSVLREGRGAALIPSLAGLASVGELPGLAATRTWVKGYNGVDWERQVLWCKGAWFLVRDTVTAREAGRYDLDLTWKTIDRGSQTVDAEGRFLARRGGAYVSDGLSTLADPQASHGKAVVLGEPSSRLVFGVELGAGNWEVDVIGYGTDGSNDSVYVSLDGSEALAAHLPQGAFGPSRGAFEAGSGTPKLTLASGGRHVVQVTLRENPPVRLDRLEFRRPGVPPVVIEAATAPGVAAADLGRLPPLALHIDAAEPVQAWVTNHVRQGISVPVSILHQRRSAELQAGQPVSFCSLVSATGPAHPTEFAVQALLPGAYRVASAQSAAAAGFGSVSLGAWQCVAGAWLVQGTSAQLVAASSVGLKESRLGFEPAANLALDLARGRLTVIAAAPTRLTVVGCTVESPAAPTVQGVVMLPAGTHELGLKGLDAASLAEVPSLAAPPAVAATATVVRPPALEPLWSLTLAAGQPVFRVTPADLNGDGTDELLVACGNAGHAVSAAGALLWSHPTAGLVRDVSLAHFSKGGPATVLVSSADTRLYQLDPAGVQQRQDTMTGIYFSADHGERPWGLYCTRAVDSDADGTDDMLITTLASMEAQGLGPDAAKRWRTLAAYHGCMDMAIRDLDQDGKPEVVIANKYGSVYVLRPDGSTVMTSITSIGDVTFGLGDLNGDGSLDIVHGSSTGDLLAVNLKGKPLWRFDNYGYPVERILCADVDGDGRPEVLVASGTGYLYCLAADGSRRWERRLGLAVHDVVVLNGTIVAGTEDGEVHALDAAGQVLWARTVGAAVVKLVGGSVAGKPAVVAGLADGRLLAFALSR